MSDEVKIIRLRSNHAMDHLGEMIEADVVIDREGFVLKDRGEFSRRRATQDELESAEEVGSCASF